MVLVMGRQWSLMLSILVIGGVTIDRLHLLSATQTVVSAGGAGMYTAVGVKAAGSQAVLFAQKPEPMPKVLVPIHKKVDWYGPLIRLMDLPRLEIVHHGNGRAELLDAYWGAQPFLDPAGLPEDVSRFSIIHIAALGPAQKQIQFLHACRRRGAKLISVGTYGKSISEDPDRVAELFDLADFFFMNENEANLLFGGSAKIPTLGKKVVFITRGGKGAVGIYSGNRIEVPTQELDAIDPTGAGDTFCGGVLAALCQGKSMMEATRVGVLLASEMVMGIGPSLLLERI